MQVLVETPRGCRNKYKLDAETGQMTLSKVLPEGMIFPTISACFPEPKGRTAIQSTC